MDGNLQSLVEELRRLRADHAQLQARLAEVLKQNADLVAEVAKLRAALEESRRSGKRQAAPFRKPGGPVAEPKKPGRKSGDELGQHRHRAVPARIDETCEVPLPDACPHCGQRHIQGVGVESQFQTEVPRQPICREFKIQIGVCADCGGRVQDRPGPTRAADIGRPRRGGLATGAGRPCHTGAHEQRAGPVTRQVCHVLWAGVWDQYLAGHFGAVDAADRQPLRGGL